MAIDPRQPTTALAGSPEKIKVMKARARLELPLFHPLDARAVSWRSEAIQSFMDAYLTADHGARYERWAARRQRYKRAHCAHYGPRRKGAAGR